MRSGRSLLADPFEEGVAEDARPLRLSGREPGCRHRRSRPRSDPPRARRSRTPSTIAVKVLLVNPSTIWGRLASTYTMRGSRWTAPKPASTIIGKLWRPIRASPPARRCRSIRDWIASWAARLSGWKRADPWSPSITVMVPPGRSRAARPARALTGRERCSRRKQGHPTAPMDPAWRVAHPRSLAGSRRDETGDPGVPTPGPVDDRRGHAAVRPPQRPRGRPSLTPTSDGNRLLPARWRASSTWFGLVRRSPSMLDWSADYRNSRPAKSPLLRQPSRYSK